MSTQPLRASAVFLLLAACATRADPVDLQDDIDRMLQQQRQHRAAAAADFRGRARFPRVHQTNEGTLTIERGELLGPYAHEFVELHVVYRNDSAATFDRIRLHFAVVDSLGRPFGRQDVALVMPMAYRFTPGNSYTDVVRVPTGGAHELPGFDVQVALAAETW